MPHITAAKLYDYTQCPHRIWRDIHGPQDEKIKETNPFVQLLWDSGVLGTFYMETLLWRLQVFVNHSNRPAEQHKLSNAQLTILLLASIIPSVVLRLFNIMPYFIAYHFLTKPVFSATDHSFSQTCDKRIVS